MSRSEANGKPSVRRLSGIIRRGDAQVAGMGEKAGTSYTCFPRPPSRHSARRGAGAKLLFAFLRVLGVSAVSPGFSG